MTPLDDPRWTRLSKTRRENLLEKNRYRDVEYHDWWDFVYEDFKEQMKELGITVIDINFSGFWCQGDGAWFGGYVDDWYLVLRELGQLLKAHGYWPHSEWSFTSTIHRGGMRYDEDLPADENPHDEEDDVLQYEAFNLRNPDQDDVDAIAKDVCELFEGKAHELYKSLRDEYDWLTSDEHIVEWLLDNMTDEELEDEDEISFA